MKAVEWGESPEMDSHHILEDKWRHPTADVMLSQRLRHWPSIAPAVGWRHLFSPIIIQHTFLVSSVHTCYRLPQQQNISGLNDEANLPGQPVIIEERKSRAKGQGYRTQLL